MERLLILLQPEYAKTILYAFCEYDGKNLFLAGDVVWRMTAAHFIDGVSVREVAARNEIPVMTCWDVLQWSKKKFQRHGLWLKELGFPQGKSKSLSDVANSPSLCV